MAVESVDNHNSERRGSVRSPLFMLVQTGDSKGAMWAWDVGLGGMQCQPEKLRFPGTYLDLMFCLPETTEVFEVGAQVMSIGETPDGKPSIGLRFCRPSRQLQLAIYRFLDKRRELWDEEKVQTKVQMQPFMVGKGKRPFEGLLLEALTALRAKALKTNGGKKSRNSDLQALTNVLGVNSEAA